MTTSLLVLWRKAFFGVNFRKRQDLRMFFFFLSNMYHLETWILLLDRYVPNSRAIISSTNTNLCHYHMENSLVLFQSKPIDCFMMEALAVNELTRKWTPRYMFFKSLKNSYQRFNAQYFHYISSRHLLVQSQQWEHWNNMCIIIVNFELTPHIALVFLLLTLNK